METRRQISDYAEVLITMNTMLYEQAIKLHMQSLLVDELIGSYATQQELIQALSDRVTLLVGHIERLQVTQQQGLGDK